MSTSLLVLLPVALLFIVSGLCFVGCGLNTMGTGFDPDNPNPKPDPVPFTKYSDTDVIGNPNCVAYWPLSEPSPPDGSVKLTADDAVGTNDGEYKHKGNAVGLFPCPDFTVDPAGPIDSAMALGILTLGVNGIVPGDTNPPYDDPNALTNAMTVDGGFVNVPANSVTNPPVFTVEFWARPEWNPATAKAAYRAVVDSRDQGGGQFFGFVVWVNQKGLWEAQLGGTGAGNYVIVPGPAAKFDTTHVVLTCDGTTATLYINGAPAPANSLPTGSFAPNTTKPLAIGVGAPYLPERTQPSDNNFFPLFPFNGTIQCVAIYNAVLSDTEIKTHFDHGSGKPDPAG